MKKIFILSLIVLISITFYRHKTDLNNNLFDLNKIVFENECFGSENSKIDNVIDNINELDEYQIVFEFADYYEPLEKPTKDISLEEAKNFIKENRINTKKYYTAYNDKLCKELMINELSNDIEVSAFSPFVFINLNTKANTSMILSKINNLSKSEKIKKIYIKQIEKWIDEVNPDLFFENIYDGGGGGTTYTGEGVVIGILDPGIVIASNSNFDDINLTVRNEWYYSETETEHATTVASIAGGAQGIAKNADILSVEVCGGLSSEVEWLLENDVNVVNMSFADSTSSSSVGNYTSNAAYIDSIVRNNFVTFVGSAGNRGEEDEYVTSPKTGYNVIAVGSTNIRGTTLSSFSSFEEKFTVSKPNLVARGENYTINEIGFQGSGTSYASPVVTGTVALMMEKRPTLMIYPELVIPLLTANADSMTNYTTRNSDGFNEHVGAGYININAVLANISNTTSFSYLTQNESGIFVSETSVNLTTNQKIKISFASLANTNGDNDTNKITDYDLKIYKSDGTLLTQITSLSNTELLEYTATISGTYIIKIYLYSAKKTDLRDYCGYAYKIS